MTFAEYFWYLLHRVFKRAAAENSDADKLAKALGPNYDQAQETIFQLREQSFLATAAGKALDQLGKDRGLPRYQDENDDAYRRRLLAAYNLYASLGTAASVRRVLEMMGYPDAQIHELYKDGVITPLFNGQHSYNSVIRHAGGRRWAEFKIVSSIGENQSHLASDARRLVDAINRVKPAHTKLAAFALDLSVGTEHLAVADEVDLVASVTAVDSAVGSQIQHDGGIAYSGAAAHNAGAIIEQVALNVIPAFNEALPGTTSYVVASRHDGGGARWRHAGSRIRSPRQIYDGVLLHNATRLRTWPRYGNKLLCHNGCRSYNYGRRHDGITSRGGSGINDDLRLVLKRRGEVIEDTLQIA